MTLPFKRHTMVCAVFAVLVAAIGLTMENDYYFQVLILIGINTILALGLNMLMGYAGQISLGHAAFYGIGAYTTAILTATCGVSPWLALPAALACAALVALIVGMPTLKLSGYYLGMGTLGFGMIVYIIFREWTSVTGGSSGLVGIPPLSAAGIDFFSYRNYFWLVWAIVLLCVIMCQRIIDSRIGRILRAIHDSEGATRACGANTHVIKLQIFILSAVFSALAGFLYAHFVTFISPGSFGFMVSIRMVTMVVIGGMASIWGAFLGAGLMTLLPEWLHLFSDYEMIVYGLILVIVMIFMPQGLFRGLLDAYDKYARFGQGKKPGHRLMISAGAIAPQAGTRQRICI